MKPEWKIKTVKYLDVLSQSFSKNMMITWEKRGECFDFISAVIKHPEDKQHNEGRSLPVSQFPATVRHCKKGTPNRFWDIWPPHIHSQRRAGEKVRQIGALAALDSTSIVANNCNSSPRGQMPLSGLLRQCNHTWHTDIHTAKALKCILFLKLILKKSKERWMQPYCLLAQLISVQVFLQGVVLPTVGWRWLRQPHHICIPTDRPDPDCFLNWDSFFQVMLGYQKVAI